MLNKCSSSHVHLLLQATLTMVMVAIMSIDSQAQSPDPSPKLREVTVKLLKPATEVKGVEVPVDIGGDLTKPGYIWENEPAVLTIHLPDGTIKKITVHAFFLNGEYGIIDGVDLLPMMKSGSYREARAEIFKALQTLDIKPDETMQKDIKTIWPNDMSMGERVIGWETYRTRMTISRNISVEVEIKPDAQGRWFCVINLDGNTDDYRAMDEPYDLLSWIEKAEGQPKSGKFREVTLPFSKPMSEVKGVKIPPYSDTNFGGIWPFFVSEPFIVSLIFSGGQTKKIAVRAFSVGRNEIVDEVMLLPMSKAASYKEAMAALREALKSLEIEPDEKLKEWMEKKWPQDSVAEDPVYHTFGHNQGGMKLTSDVLFEVVIQHDAANQWYVELTFSAGLNKQLYWSSASSPEVKPQKSADKASPTEGKSKPSADSQNK